MADLAVTAHQHPKVALPARTNSSSQAEATFVFSLEHLLQGGVMTASPNAANLLRVEREPMDRGTDEIADLSRKRIPTRRQEMIDDNRDADSAMPIQQGVQQERDHARSTSADSDNAEYLDERVEPASPAAPADAQAATQAADSGRPVNAVSPPPRQGAAEPAPSSGPSFVPTISPSPRADAAEPATAAPGPGQPAASIVREADFLVSQSSSALAPTAALAAEQFQGQGHRLRPASPGPSVGTTPAVTAPSASKGGGSERPVQPVADVGASLETAGRPGAPQAAAGAALPGAVDPSATTAAAGVQAAQGQNGAMTATASTAPSSPDKTLVAPSSASASDARGPAGIAASSALGDSQVARQTIRTAGAPARADPFQQRVAGDQVSVHIKKAVQEGTDRIEIRLKPEALGRVDVRLELGSEGRVVATVTADQRHTLELLRSDARNLERALQEAGLQTDSGSLNFNLRSGGDERPGSRDGHPAAAPVLAESGADSRSGQTPPPPAFGRASARPDGIDIHA